MDDYISRLKEEFGSLPWLSSYLSWRSFRALLRERRKVGIYYENRRLEFIQSKKSYNEMQELDHEEGVESQCLDDSIDRARSRRLIEQCILHDVEIPQGDDIWQKSLDGSERHLSPKARMILRNLIREEKAKSSQDVARWIPFITAVGGIIGLLIGLVSVWKK